MSSNSRVTRSKGESDGLSLPVRTRQRRKSTNMENDENTALNTTFDTGLDQHHPQMPVHTSPLPAQPPRPTSAQSVTGPIIGDRQPSTTLVTHDSRNRCQSTPPPIVKMWETPVPALPPIQQRPLTPCIPLPKSQDSGSYSSQMSVPLFTEDRYSSSSEDDLAMCDAEITQINRQNEPPQAFAHNSTTERPTSTLATMDYTTQGDPNQVAPPTYINTAQATAQNQFLHTNNFFIPDGSS